MPGTPPLRAPHVLCSVALPATWTVCWRPFRRPAPNPRVAVRLVLPGRTPSPRWLAPSGEPGSRLHRHGTNRWRRWRRWRRCQRFRPWLLGVLYGMGQLLTGQDRTGQNRTGQDKTGLLGRRRFRFRQSQRPRRAGPVSMCESICVLLRAASCDVLQTARLRRERPGPADRTSALGRQSGGSRKTSFGATGVRGRAWATGGRAGGDWARRHVQHHVLAGRLREREAHGPGDVITPRLRAAAAAAAVGPVGVDAARGREGSQRGA